MKGLILSGGRGTRLRPLTYTSAKQLIPVANRPILFYGIQAIRDSGIREIGIIVGDTQAEIKAAVGDGRRFGVKVTYIHQPEPLGLAHAVLTAEKYLAGDSFVMYLGDNLLKSGIKPLVDEFRKKKPHAMILLAHVPNPSQFGVAELKAGRVKRLTEKPRRPKSDLALVGVYLFDRHVFQAAKAIKPSGRGELEITDAIQWLVDHNFRVLPQVVEGWWKDTGRVEDILEANRMVLDTLETRIQGRVDAASRVEFKVVIEKGARIERSVIRGPAIIGENAKVIDSYIGPFTSIDRGCRVERAELEHSILLAGSELRDIPQRIEDSLVGRNVVIARGSRRPAVLRFVVGDASQVELT